MNDFAWLFWDRPSLLSNQRKRRAVEVMRVLGLSPAQLEKSLMLGEHTLTHWCKGLVPNRYASMRLVRIHRVVNRKRDQLPDRRRLGQLLERPIVGGQSLLSILTDPYFLEYRLEMALTNVAQAEGGKADAKAGEVVRLLTLTPA